jgi:hypothetical protein
MELIDSGTWTKGKWPATADEWHDEHVALAREWNRLVPEYKAPSSQRGSAAGRKRRSARDGPQAAQARSLAKVDH